MIINKLKLNLKRCGITPTMDAAQGDVLSRGLELSLFDGAKPYLLPENLAVLIRYKKADGKGGEYDTMPDGSPAWSAEGNRLTILLTRQMFTFPGSVSMTIALVSGGTQISTFPVQINVLPEAKALAENSEDYFNVTGFLVAPGNAETGQFLQVKAVNSEGRVTQVESGFPQQTPADWNAGEGDPGHILNRPFYESDGTVKKIDKKFLPDDVGGVNLTGAVPGQTLLVKSVDENGKPTAWEAVDPVTGADWNAGEGAPGHVQNRPFYSEYGEETVILPETTITVEEMTPIEYPLFIIAGEEYTVSWNRTVYHCTAVSYSEDGMEGTVLGDLGMITNGVPTTGEPFVLLVFSEEYAATEGFSGVIVPLDGATELTISITGPVETVTPIPKKYLPELRGQKKYVLDLDNGTTPSLEELCKLDTAEIQASLVCIHEGVEKSVIIVNRTDGYYEGMYIADLHLYVPLTYGKYNYYRWDTISGFRLIEEYWTPEMIEAGMSGTFMLVRQQNEAVPNWRRINEVALPGIVLSSTTQGSTKKFLITVDDSGNLTATQK